MAEAPRNPNVSPEELYQGPRLAVAAPGPGPWSPAPMSDQQRPTRDRGDYVATLTACLDVLNARLLALIATVTACVIWGVAIYNPSDVRIYAAIGFSACALWPLVLLHWKRG